ncbi:neurotrypsin-like, partial [Mizuhopecten yessoensis]|uniref:neurotrypsin-like n=1 Tax=Mizuhopecten yessoensis TaxID=6573 RepID=UPI000B45C5AF
SSLAFRLVDGANNYTGQIEVYYGGYWGSICPQNGYNHAEVACRMFNYSDGWALRVYKLSEEPVWMNNLRCNGSESSLADCQFDGWGQAIPCLYQAHVRCHNVSATSDIAVRLMGGPDTNVGRVEVFNGGMWGTVCADPNWNNKEANVTCRMLGH